MGIEMQGEANEPNIVQFHDSGFNAIKSRIDAVGAFVTAVNTEPSGTTLAIGECAMWFKPGSMTVIPSVNFIARDYAGNIRKIELQFP